MLIGQYFSKITLKNRISVPKKFRSEIGDKLIVAKWYEGCLVIVPEIRWKEILDKLTGKMEIITKAVRDTDRFILGSAYELELDAQGRFVIPAILKEYAGLSENVIFLGLGERIELWDEKSWKEKEKSVTVGAAESLESISDK
jgi:MraZ protein